MCIATNYLNFNESDYLVDANSHASCLKCIRQLQNYHRFPALTTYKKSRVSTPDCQYSFSLTNEDQHSNEFIFQIKQENCSTEVKYLGSSFDIYARNDKQLVHCSIFNADHFYNVSCLIDSTMENNALICINITAILYSENYDVFSMNAIDALPMIHILKNDIEYCKENNKNISFNEYSEKIPLLDDLFQIITGNWKSDIETKLFRNTSSNGNAIRKGLIFPRINIHNENMITSTLRIPRQGSANYTLNEQHIVVAAYKKSLSQYYKYEPIIISASSTSASYAQMDVLPVRALKNSEVDSDAMNYLFLGSSHERYLYNAIIENLLNDSNAFMNLSIKHDHHTHINASNFYMEFLAFAEHSAKYLDSFCQVLQTAYQNFSRRQPQQWTKSFRNSIYNFTVIIGTGAWDLQNAHIAYSLKSKRSANLLMTTMKRIRNGDLYCPGLNHVVFISPLPYPIHHSPYLQNMKGGGFRNPESVSALNEFYIQEFLKLNIKSNVKLSFVDAYQIMKPRLLLDEDVEFVCNGHFLCRINRKQWYWWPSNFKEVLQTPAGNALLNAVMNALV